MKYNARPQNEREVIAKAYSFEIEAIESFDATRNPWVDEIKSWEDGEAIWEAINEAVEMAYGAWATANCMIISTRLELDKWHKMCDNGGR